MIDLFYFGKTTFTFPANESNACCVASIWVCRLAMSIPAADAASTNELAMLLISKRSGPTVSTVFQYSFASSSAASLFFSSTSCVKASRVALNVHQTRVNESCIVRYIYFMSAIKLITMLFFRYEAHEYILCPET